MSGDKSGTVDLKTLTAIIGVVGAIAAAAGSWYVNDYRIDQLEKDAHAHDEKAMKQIAEVKCLVAEIHKYPLPECR